MNAASSSSLILPPSSFVTVLLHHPHAPSAARIDDLIHIRFHQQNPPATGLEQVLPGARIRHFFALETLALVFDYNLSGLGRDLGFDVNDLVRVVLVAVLD